MKEIIKLGLVIGALFCAAICAASAQEEYSEDYKNGFYDAAVIVGQATGMGGSLEQLYNALGGEATPETADIVEYYNNQTTLFNQQVIPYVNGIIDQVFGPEDNRSADLYLVELPFIS